MTTSVLRLTPINLDKSPLSAVDEEAVRLADVLEDHPDASDVTDSGRQGGSLRRGGRSLALSARTGSGCTPVWEAAAA
ncbi:hypothetical protein [Streptomyces sp. SP18CS02]|uniref:hypothetical protein n=1 Tax=Streptomyces sp. SP18CS02 TaxID=3002531 RepID=UPI002E76A8C8|nr:hypothetical protein [Streptomyces sp. SP18CS02]MEE1752004.1 hypothetical protein [Streptomyces sp. SP18CS02]